jgi:hypothetical protein
MAVQPAQRVQRKGGGSSDLFKTPMEICWQFDYAIDIEKLRNLCSKSRHVMMPALVRVGAVTERSRALYEAEGIPVWSDASKLEAMEDSETGAFDLDRADG